MRESVAGYGSPSLGSAEFENFRRFILDEAGIDMPAGKREMVQSRLSKRLRVLQLNSYSAYWRWIHLPGNEAEWQRALNLLTTNETYFFREPQHFSWLQHQAADAILQRNDTFRVWSAASSTGEEAYTIAMILAETLGVSGNWQVCASDINTRVTHYARRAVYPLERVSKTPKQLWQRYFQRGKDEFAGHVRVRPDLARRVEFSNVNLLRSSEWPARAFDVVFLRNVLIYFNEKTKLQVLSQICDKIRPGGYLLIGHSEVIREPQLPLKMEGPSRYRYVPWSAEAGGGQ